MQGSRTLASKYRWLVIFAAFVVMMIISVYQYSWFLFAYAIQEQLRWDLATIGLTFTVFAYAATFVQPLSGFVADSYGPRTVAVIASFFVGIGFVLASYADSHLALYLFYGLGGLGVGILYGISTACAIKWFPDKRGFATGMVVFGFGAGTALFNWLIQASLDGRGIRPTFMYTGILMLVTLIPLSFLYKYPPQDPLPPLDSNQGNLRVSTDFKPAQMLKTYQWFLIYFSFIATVSIVLMFGAQMKTLAKEFKIPANYFSILLVLFPLGNGLSRVLSGAVSDKLGREKTMAIFYSLLGLSILCFFFLSYIPLLFVTIVCLAALLGGSPFALYPATIGDYYGSKYSTTNYGITYTAKAWAGLISGWLSGYLVLKFGSYKFPLFILAMASLLAAVLSSPVFMKAPEKQLG